MTYNDLYGASVTTFVHAPNPEKKKKNEQINKRINLLLLRFKKRVCIFKNKKIKWLARMGNWMVNGDRISCVVVSSSLLLMMMFLHCIKFTI